MSDTISIAPKLPDGTLGSFDESTDRLLLRWLQSVTTGWDSAALEMETKLSENPGRISRAYREMLSGYASDPGRILTTAIEIAPGSHHGLVTANRIPFLSFCAHHFLPFTGSIDIVYEPGPQIVGIGKMPRLVDCRARRFQLQELLVKEIADDMMNHAQARGVYVRSSAQHLCVCYRGPNHSTVLNVATYALGTLVGNVRFGEIALALQAQ